MQTIAAWLLLAGLAGAAAASAEVRREEAGPALPQGLQLEWNGTLTQGEDGTVTITGAVKIVWRDTRIQADRLLLRERRYVEAEGNVLLVWGKSRIFGRRMSYDLETERGVIEDALGQTLDDYLFWAETAEKIGDDKVRVTAATVTTCSQPVPYWSFAVSSATIHIDHYARMWNVRLRAGPMPLIYLPYLVWPVRPDRAPGLLTPDLHSSQSRGQMISQALFLPFGRSADLTLEGRYYTEAGFGGGGGLRVIPNRSGRLDADAFFINDKVYAAQHGGDGNRYQVRYRQEQRFLNGFRMVADIDEISDPDYLGDYKRDLNVSSTPQTLARLEFSRNGPWVSMNVREVRRELLSSGQVQQALPEVEWRGRSRRLGRTPLYLSFEASGASIQQFAQASPSRPPFDPDYLRGDLFPTLSLPWSPTPWLDLTPQVSERVTYYTQRQTPGPTGRVVEDRSLSRSLPAYGLEIVGPKLSRVFAAERSPRRYKHTLEPRIRYGYAESFDEADEILLYDEVDRVNGAGEQVGYALVQRLFAKRPRAAEPEPAGDAERDVVPDAGRAERSPEAAPGSRPGPVPPAAGEPVEIAQLEISQSRSFERDISRADVDGDGQDETSRFSPILVTGRFNPGSAVSLDLRSRYDILFDQVQDVSLSGTLQHAINRLRFSLVYDNGLGLDPATGQERDDSSQLRLTDGVTLAGGRVAFNVDGSYLTDPPEGTSHFPDQRFQLQYSTQCCTFFLERLTRDFATTEDRRELYFRLDLRGVGKVLSSTF